jgi:hypothetical protein
MQCGEETQVTITHKGRLALATLLDGYQRALEVA